ncbi:hypothetical protein AGOR_G00075540 [Albula goreensis]|uniref:Uncharacterized protein n=1 Tax=Albula goreensis TaxID=1534307 RepID=A0A8T3DWT0_9TELE|nr:hypothetical protein AGOR_G00075540 [Albula goreensis]
MTKETTKGNISAGPEMDIWKFFRKGEGSNVGVNEKAAFLKPRRVTYSIAVTTGNMLNAGTVDDIYITLVGTEGVSRRTHLNNFGRDFAAGSTRPYNMTCSASLGKLLLIRLEKKRCLFFPSDEWFCSKVVVTTPESDPVCFPCYRWMSEGEILEIREATARKIYEDDIPQLINLRNQELVSRRQLYQWRVFLEGIPETMLWEDLSDLPAETRFSFSKAMEFQFTTTNAISELALKGLLDRKKPWANLEDISQVFWSNKTDISEYVREHWKEDDFFGYQFLNGANPMVICRCTKLPPNFPITNDMVQPFLEKGTSLKSEMQKGNIFLCDYKLLDGLPTSKLNEKQQYQVAPLCLLYKTPEDKLLPIAIQLKQQPGDLNPIFLPSDSEHDWLLAKIFVRSAEFNEHQLNSHLLRTHLLAEVFTISLLRNLPTVHPLHKLLLPHTRYTIQINSLARRRLISEEGVISQIAGTGGKGVNEFMKRAFASLTYSSLCLPEDIAARGLESVPRFYYRDDGLKLWDIINRYVEGMVQHYYPSDSDVQQDTELQSWIKEIFTHGFLEQSSTGIPQSFGSVKEVIKFVTMIIFTVSAQHSAINNSQFDYGAWTPNYPSSMQQPPPTTKGSSDESTILEALPDVSVSALGVGAIWLLSKKASDSVPLGVFPEEHFCEEVPLKLVLAFQEELKITNESIKERNAALKLPYPYLCPENMENSRGKCKNMEETDLSNFNELRQKYIQEISQNLGEARALMNKVNSNLQIWTERTGELDHLAAVWAAFQNKLACLSSALGDSEDRPETESDEQTTSEPLAGTQD